MDIRVQGIGASLSGDLEMDVAHLRSLAHAHMPNMTGFLGRFDLSAGFSN